MKTRLFTIAAMLFVLALSAMPAQAQDYNMCCFSAIGNNPWDYPIGPLQTTPAFGFTAYSTPSFPFFIYMNLTIARNWTSTCPDGGVVTGRVSTLPDQAANPQTIYQVNIDATIKNPLTNWVQGQYSGIATVLTVGQPPSFVPFKDEGGPCRQSSREMQSNTPQ